MIQCPFCPSKLSTSGSYRVHKHRYHRVALAGSTVTKQDYPASLDNATSEDSSSVDNVIKQVQYANAPADADLQTDNTTAPAFGACWITPENRSQRIAKQTKNNNDGLAIIAGLGVIAVALILALFGKKK